MADKSLDFARQLCGEFLDLLTPPICLLCERAIRDGGSLCHACTGELPLVTQTCRNCSRGRVDPLDPGCVVCRERVLSLPIRHAGWHRGKLRDLILAAKWHGLSSAAKPLARLSAEQASHDNWSAGLDGWVAIPRDPLRRFLRGPPLSEALGEEIGKILDLKRIAPPKRRRSRPQTALAASARRSNLRRVFHLTRAGRRSVAGKNILLIDDVLTTGHTLEECAKVLRAGGADSVRGLVVAVAPLEAQSSRYGKATM